MSPMITCKVQIALNDLSCNEANAIKCALEPDNIKVPDGLHLDVSKDTHGNKLILNFDSVGGGSGSSSTPLSHLVGTIDEVLEHTGVALKVIREC